MKCLMIVILGLVLLIGGGCGGTSSAGGVEPDGTKTYGVALAVDIGGVELLNAPTTGHGDNTPEHYELSILHPKQVLRRIDPGVIPDGAGLGDISYSGAGNWRISNLPIGETMLLQIAFTPVPTLVPGDGSLPMNHPSMQAVHIPFSCEDDGGLSIDTDIWISRHPDGNYTSDTQADIADGAAMEEVSIRIDYTAGLVSQDSDHDGQFIDEAWLADTGRIGISNQLGRLLASENSESGAAVKPVALEGRLQSVNEAAGKLWLEDAVQFAGYGREELGNVEVSFAEGTGFDELLVDRHGELLHNKAPRALEIDERITVWARSLPEYDNSSRSTFWVDGAEMLSLDFPVDTIVAVPSKLTAVPGEAVPVTVYVNKTTHDFYSLDNVRIVFEAGNEIQPGSINAGRIGGPANSPDGIWAEMDTSLLVFPGEVQLSGVSAAADWKYVDISLRPRDGREISNATGALLNFELICHYNATPAVQSFTGNDWITMFSDKSESSHTWQNIDNIKASSVDVEGTPLRVTIVDPPAQGDGTTESPYVVRAGTAFQLRMIDPVFGNVTHHPDAMFRVTSDGDKTLLSVTDGVLSISEGFSGDLRIRGVFQNVYTRLDDMPHLTVVGGASDQSGSG